MSMKAIAVFAVVLLISTCCSADLDSFDDDLRVDATAAAAFCAKPSFKQLQCGFASTAEESATTSKQCPYCGTALTSVPAQLPATMNGHQSYTEWAARVISLACSGRVLVRSVFKITEQEPITLTTVLGLQGTSCTSSRLDTSATPNAADSTVIRCELQLPTGAGSEAERALKSKEVNCYKCGLCGEGLGCPSKTGVWYSDTYTTNVSGCKIDAKQGYTARKAHININPGAKVLLAKFEVCNSARCFNQAYEDAKAKSAKACIRGKCA